MTRDARRTAGYALVVVCSAIAFLVFATSRSEAVHFYRGTANDCSSNSGDLTDDPLGETGTIGATVLMLHNTLHDSETGGPITRIQAGQAVRWEWRSAHCHSIQHMPEGPQQAPSGYGMGSFKLPGALFYSGYYYPAAPCSPTLLPGAFDCPVPLDEGAVTLTYTHTFTEPGTYYYRCEHHGAIGMIGTVIVEDPY